MSELLIIALCFMPLALYLALNSKKKEDQQSLSKAVFLKYLPMTRSMKQEIPKSQTQ